MSEGKPTIENQADIETPEHESANTGTPSGAPIPPMVVLGFVIIALLGGLVTITLRGGFGSSSADPAEVAKQKAEINALQNQLNRNRLELGLRPLEGGSESIEEVATRLKKEADTMVVMAGSLEKLLTESEAKNRATESKLLQSETSRQNLAADSVRMQEEIRRALVISSEADMHRRDLAAAKSRNDALMGELDQMRKELAVLGEGASKADLSDLQRRLDEALRAKDFFESKVNQLQNELSSTQSKLFAATENELLPAAVELVRSLRKLENLPDSEITQAYSKIGVDLGASVLRKLEFATGSSKLTPADEEAIRNVVADIPDGDLVLAIGYASETGNVDGNRVLSSDRATAAAQLYSSIKRPEQLVQAVYLGQTDRFSSRLPERNQIVEIWRIRKK